MAQSKFNAGNTAWCILHNRVMPVSITGVKEHKDTDVVIYSIVAKLPFFGTKDFFYTTIAETELYRTPDELISALKETDYTKTLEEFMREVKKVLNK